VAAEVDVTARKIVVQMLAAGHTQLAAAKAANYSRKTVADLLKRPEFVAEINAVRAAGRATSVPKAAPRVEQLPINQHQAVKTNGTQIVGVESVEEEIKEARAFLRRVISGKEDDIDGLLKHRIVAAKAVLAMPGRIILAAQPQAPPVEAPEPAETNIIPIQVIQEASKKWLEMNS
jgi:hypothetical protein